MIDINDPNLPGIAGLDDRRLRQITGADTVDLMRFRYREGKRAIVHVRTTRAGCEQQGALWFFRGGKARQIARRNKVATYDQTSGALYEVFPHDHRMPVIRRFLTHFDEVADALLVGRPDGPARLVRYRPGLSCTFCCPVIGQDPVFVKLVHDDSAASLARMNRLLSHKLRGGRVAIAPVIATEPRFNANVFRAAPGVPLDVFLQRTGSVQPIRQSIDALRQFWNLAANPAHRLTRQVLEQRAADNVRLVGATVPQVELAVREVHHRLMNGALDADTRPIHGDVKLEHLFLDGENTTLIDTESVTLGPPDYDLAQLYGRLWQAECEDLLDTNLVQQACQEIRREATGAFGWCLDVVALRLAKFYAQRPAPDSAKKIATILQRLQ